MQGPYISDNKFLILYSNVFEAKAGLWKQGKNCQWQTNYRQVSNISRTLVDNKIVDHSDVVGASPVGAAPTTSSFST